MAKLILSFLLLAGTLYPQQIDFNSPVNIKLFADYLFCTGDFLRAAIEYKRYTAVIPDDSVMYRIGLSYNRIGKYDTSSSWFGKINSTALKSLSIMQASRNLLEQQEYPGQQKFYNEHNDSLPEEYKSGFTKQYFLSLLLDDSLPPKKDFGDLFSRQEEPLSFYNRLENPGYKSPVTAAILSAIIPGLGKIYTTQYGDGITSFIANGLLAFLAVDNFNAGHNTRGYIFSGLFAFFYAGNIYGSAASANIYNQQLKVDLNFEIDEFLRKENWFIPEIIFCR